MDYAYKIALTGQGNACITGLTKSEDFPIKVPYQETYGGGDTDAFVTKLTSDGSGLEFSSYLGGSGADWGRGIEVDASGMIYVMGDTTSTDYPTEVPYQSTNHGERDIFVAKMSTDGTKLIFSTYLVGSTTIGDVGPRWIQQAIYILPAASGLRTSPPSTPCNLPRPASTTY